MRDGGVTPRVVPIRGGTSGARLSYEGLPCPNLFTGGENYHGRFEYVPVEDMEAAVRTLKYILRNAAKYPGKRGRWEAHSVRRCASGYIRPDGE